MTPDDHAVIDGRTIPGLAGLVVVVIGVGLLIAFTWSKSIVRGAPVLAIASVEPSAIFDDYGSEMWLVTLSVSNSETVPPVAENYLYIKDGTKPIEARVATRWTPVDGSLDFHALAPGRECEKMFLVPAGTDLCRVSLKYTGAHLIKGRLAWLAEQSPKWFRFRLPGTFWRWVGFTDYRASQNWREITVDLPFAWWASQTAAKTKTHFTGVGEGVLDR